MYCIKIAVQGLVIPPVSIKGTQKLYKIISRCHSVHSIPSKSCVNISKWESIYAPTRSCTVFASILFSLNCSKDDEIEVVIFQPMREYSLIPEDSEINLGYQWVLCVRRFGAFFINQEIIMTKDRYKSNNAPKTNHSQPYF